MLWHFRVQTIDKLDYRATEKCLKFTIPEEGENMETGRIEFSATASLVSSAVAGANFANFRRNFAAENSITLPFHLAQQLLIQIFTALNSIGTKFNYTGAIYLL